MTTIDYIPNDHQQEGAQWWLTFYKWTNESYREPQEHIVVLVTKPTKSTVRKLRRQFRKSA